MWNRAVRSDVRQQDIVVRTEAAMNIEDQVREAIVAELKRQSEAGEPGLRVRTGEAETITIEGQVNLDELTMAVVGSLAGGP
jgi:hypothetical protein